MANTADPTRRDPGVGLIDGLGKRVDSLEDSTNRRFDELREDVKGLPLKIMEMLRPPLTRFPRQPRPQRAGGRLWGTPVPGTEEGRVLLKFQDGAFADPFLARHIPCCALRSRRISRKSGRGVLAAKAGGYTTIHRVSDNAQLKAWMEDDDKMGRFW